MAFGIVFGIHISEKIIRRRNKMCSNNDTYDNDVVSVTFETVLIIGDHGTDRLE
jgi:hypothetical protein